MWNWQNINWPKFEFEKEALSDLEITFLQKISESHGALKHFSKSEKSDFTIELITNESLQTSKIEGEILDHASIQSSIKQAFGLQDNGIITPIPNAEAGVAAMLTEVHRNNQKDPSHESLFSWHKMLLGHRKDLSNLGSYRSHKEPMLIMSGSVSNPKIHFEAPPSQHVFKEMDLLLKWLESSKLPPLTKAGLCHLHFISIHPFEDGNGRIARALTEKSLSKDLGQDCLISISTTIEKNKKDYYEALNNANKSLDVTDWLSYFSKTLIKAQLNTVELIEFTLDKKRYFQSLDKNINNRQKKVLERMLQEGLNGFSGGLSADNYINITQTSKATATRDLQDLVQKKALIKKGELKYSRYQINIPSILKNQRWF